MATEKEQVQEFLSIVGKSLHQYVESIDFDALSAAKKLILDAEAKGGRLHVTGIGKPGHVSGYAASLFSSTGTIAGVEQEGDSMNKPPRASILAEIMELQCLSILLQNEYGLNPEQYVKWHPGGALGASIREGK